MLGWSGWLFRFPLPGPRGRRRGGRPTVNWPLHNLDLAGSRFSPMTQINRANVKSLVPRWLFQHGVIDGVSNQTTPVIVDGTMYVTDARGSVYAVDAADGHLLWTYDVTGPHRRRRARRLRLPQPRRRLRRRRRLCRGRIVPLRARRENGQAASGFGKNGQASVILDVLRRRYPDVKTADQPGLLVHHGAADLQRRALHRQHAQREPYSRRPRARRRCENGQGALALQHGSAGRKDQGWDIAGPTWVGGERNGGGIWETPAIDPALGLLYVAVGNPFGDSKKRRARTSSPTRSSR